MLAQQHHFFNITSETDIKQGYEVYIFKTRLTKCKEKGSCRVSSQCF